MLVCDLILSLEFPYIRLSCQLTLNSNVGFLTGKASSRNTVVCVFTGGGGGVRYNLEIRNKSTKPLPHIRRIEYLI